MFSSSTTAVAILAIDFACLIKLVAQCARLGGGQAPSLPPHRINDTMSIGMWFACTTPCYILHSLCYHIVARQKRACYVDWIIGRMPPPLRFWVGENQTHQICLITSLLPPHKQSSAFSNIEAILSIMAKVSLVTANESEVHSTLYPAVHQSACWPASQTAGPSVRPRERQSQKQLERKAVVSFRTHYGNVLL